MIEIINDELNADSLFKTLCKGFNDESEFSSYVKGFVRNLQEQLISNTVESIKLKNIKENIIKKNEEDREFYEIMELIDDKIFERSNLVSHLENKRKKKENAKKYRGKYENSKRKS
ncbi:hypothetical protein JW865_09465 [Candidatus Bathyarchaeota archaeon]|nr:hypothetical protein [Candidatus Bathyarchaeota archaeon]